MPISLSFLENLYQICGIQITSDAGVYGTLAILNLKQFPPPLHHCLTRPLRKNLLFRKIWSSLRVNAFKKVSLLLNSTILILLIYMVNPQKEGELGILSKLI